MKKILFRRKIEIILIMIISIILGIVYATKIKVPKYISSSTLILKQKDVAIDSKTIATYNEVLKSNGAVKTIKSNLNINLSEEQLQKKLQLKDMSNSDMIEISVTDQNPQRACDISKEATNIFIQKVQEIYEIEDVHIIDEPEIASKSSNINYVKDITNFFIGGLVVSTVLVIFLEIFNKKIVSTKMVERKTKLNVIAKLTYCKSEEQVNQNFRELKNCIRVIDKNFNSILITGNIQNEGKSWIASNLAVSFAKTGKKVIIIDVNLKRGKQYKFFNVSSKPGLSDFLKDSNKNLNVNIADYIKETKIRNLYILPAGEPAANSLELLISDKMIELLEELKSIFDMLIIDGTSSSNIKDSLVISKNTEATIITTEYNKTKIDILNRTKRNLLLVGANVIGVIINKAPNSRKKYIDSYFYNSPTGRREKQLGRHAVKIDKKEKEESNIKKIKHAKTKENSTENHIVSEIENDNNIDVLQKIKEKQIKMKKEAEEKKMQEKIEKTIKEKRQSLVNRSRNTLKQQKTAEIEKVHKIYELPKKKLDNNITNNQEKVLKKASNVEEKKSLSTRTKKLKSEREEKIIKKAKRLEAEREEKIVRKAKELEAEKTAKEERTIKKEKELETSREKRKSGKTKKLEYEKEERATKKRSKADNTRAAEMLEQINEYLRIEREKNK